MIYLDTSCLLKLYYPEPESQHVANLVAGVPLAFTLLHELEITNALELKVFWKQARLSQTKATVALLDQDLRSGVLRRVSIDGPEVYQEAKRLAKAYTRTLGCRSLDILHCAAAHMLTVDSFLTADARQQQLAMATGLRCLTL